MTGSEERGQRQTVGAMGWKMRLACLAGGLAGIALGAGDINGGVSVRGIVWLVLGVGFVCLAATGGARQRAVLRTMFAAWVVVSGVSAAEAHSAWRAALAAAAALFWTSLLVAGLHVRRRVRR